MMDPTFAPTTPARVIFPAQPATCRSRERLTAIAGIAAAFLAALCVCAAAWTAGGGGGSPPGEPGGGALLAAGGGGNLAVPGEPASGQPGASSSGEAVDSGPALPDYKPPEIGFTTPEAPPPPQDPPPADAPSEQEKQFKPKIEPPGGEINPGGVGRNGSGGGGGKGGSGGGKGGGTGGGDGEGTEFMGIKTKSNRVCFVIDFSSSMSQDDRLIHTKLELRRAIEKLPEDGAFSVIFFSSVALPMPPGKMIPANENNKRAAIQWVREQNGGGGTDPTEAMELALGDPQPDTIYLMTDGIFRSEGVFELLDRLNGERKVSVNTIAFHTNEAEPVLQRIASENKGDYIFIPAPPTKK